MRTPQETAYRCMFGTPCTLCWNALGFLDKTNVLSLNPIWSDGICSQIVQSLFYVAQQHTHSSSGLQIQACCKQCIEELPVYTRIKHDHDTPKTSISGGTDWAADKAACNVAEWLKDSGYEVVPDVFEVSSNFWGLVNKVHMETFFFPSLTSYWLLSCSHQLTFTLCVDRAIWARQNILPSISARDQTSSPSTSTCW